MEFYYNIYQLEDAPHDSVIENDDELDLWLETRKTKKEDEERKSRLEAAKSRGGKGHSKIREVQF